MSAFPSTSYELGKLRILTINQNWMAGVRTGAVWHECIFPKLSPFVVNVDKLSSRNHQKENRRMIFGFYVKIHICTLIDLIWQVKIWLAKKKSVLKYTYLASQFWLKASALNADQKN